MRDCVLATLLSLPMMLIISRNAGWDINALQLLCLTAMYAVSTMALHICSISMLSRFIRRAEDDKEEDPDA